MASKKKGRDEFFFKFDMEREKRASQGWKSISLWKAKQAKNTFDRAGRIVSRKSNFCLFTFSLLPLSWCFIEPSEWVIDWVSVNVFQRTPKGETESICCSQVHTYCAAIEYQRVHLVLCCAMENLWWKISVNNRKNYALVFTGKIITWQPCEQLVKRSRFEKKLKTEDFCGNSSRAENGEKCEREFSSSETCWSAFPRE